LAQGQWPWGEPALFAPMEGVTHPSLRALMAERGAIGVVCTEFVRITGNPVSDKVLARHVVRAPGAALSVQVMGNDLANMAEAAELVTARGADIVDINLGCPAPKAVRKGVGSALLKDRRLLSEVVRSMRARTWLPLSAKIRAGFDDAANVVEIAKAVEGAGADFLTVHPRRRTDFYRGVADWRIVARLREVLSIPVVGNGDVWYAADALRMQSETGCVAVMIGRPALRNPWIFTQVAALRARTSAHRPSGADLAAHLRLLAERCTLDGFSPKGLLGHLKELLLFFARALPPEAREHARQVLRETTVPGVLLGAERWLAPLGAAELDLAPEGGTLETSGRVDQLRDIA
jgi:nifR3 family TIM-barrel protein